MLRKEIYGSTTEQRERWGFAASLALYSHYGAHVAGLVGIGNTISSGLINLFTPPGWRDPALRRRRRTDSGSHIHRSCEVILLSCRESRRRVALLPALPRWLAHYANAVASGQRHLPLDPPQSVQSLSHRISAPRA